MRTTSRFIIPAFSAVGGILITLEHGLSGIIKRNGEADFNSFHFSFDSTARYICMSVCMSCVCVCESASSVLRHSMPRNATDMIENEM